MQPHKFSTIYIHLGSASGEWAVVIFPEWLVWPAERHMLRPACLGLDAWQSWACWGGRSHGNSKAPLMSIQKGSGRTCWQSLANKTLLLTDSARNGHTHIYPSKLWRQSCSVVSPSTQRVRKTKRWISNQQIVKLPQNVIRCCHCVWWTRCCLRNQFHSTYLSLHPVADAETFGKVDKMPIKKKKKKKNWAKPQMRKHINL